MSNTATMEKPNASPKKVRTRIRLNKRVPNWGTIYVIDGKECVEMSADYYGAKARKDRINAGERQGASNASVIYVFPEEELK